MILKVVEADFQLAVKIENEVRELLWLKGIEEAADNLGMRATER